MNNKVNRNIRENVVTSMAVGDWYIAVFKDGNKYTQLITKANFQTELASGIALIEKIAASEATIADFAAASAGYTFQQGDIIILSTGDAYWYLGGTKTVVGSYTLANLVNIDWANVNNKPDKITELVTNAEIKDLQATPKNSINASTRLLFDPLQVQSLDWELRQLKNELGAVAFDWNISEITHADLLALKTAGTLIPFKKYVITDYEAFAGSGVETLVLTATSIDTFDVRVQSVEYPQDIIEYNIAGTDGVGTKGLITYRKDNNNNITHYDHRKITTFGDNATSNSFGTNVTSNSFGTNATSNSFGTNATSNSFGDGAYSNSFGDGTISNSFGTNATSNSFGDGTDSNSFGTNATSNSFGNRADSNSFGDNAKFNIFGHNISNLTVLANFQNNTIESNIDFTGIDFSLATHVYAAYHCDIFKNSNGDIKLGYYNASNVYTIVNVNS